MDFIVGLIVIGLVLASWYFLVKFLFRQAKKLLKNKDVSEPIRSYRGKPLDKNQKKKFKDYPGHSKTNTPSSLTSNQAAPKTRAIKQGWRIGEVKFTYEDAQGNLSERHVIVHHADLHYIKGECLTRNAERTFRTDRIIGGVVDCSTGEIIAPYELHMIMEK